MIDVLTMPMYSYRNVIIHDTYDNGLAKCEDNSNLKKANRVVLSYKSLCLLLGRFIYQHAFIAITNVGVDIGQRGPPTCFVGFNAKHDVCQGYRFAFITFSKKFFSERKCVFSYGNWQN